MAEEKKQPTIGSSYTAGALNLNAAKSGARDAQFDFNTLLKPVATAVAERANTVEAARKEFEKNKPEDYNVELLEGKAKENMVVFIDEMKEEYNIAAKTATAYSSKTNSQEYKDAVARMEKVKGALKKNYDGFKAYQEDRSNRIKNSGREVSMGLTDQTQNDLIISPEGYNYITPTIDGPVFNDGVEGSEDVALGSLFKPDYMDGESATLITDTYITNPTDFGTKDTDPDVFARTLKNQTFEIINDKALVRRITFNGLSNDPDTRFIDYYVAEKSLNGELPDVGIIDINDDGVIDAEDRGKDGNFAFEDDDRSKFDKVIEGLKNDKSFDPSKELGVFLEQIGNDRFKAARSAKDDNKVYNLESFGKVTKKSLRNLFDDINSGRTLVDQNDRTWRRTEGGWVTDVKNELGETVDSAPQSTAKMYQHLDLTLHAEELGYDKNGNKIEEDGTIDESSTQNNNSNTVNSSDNNSTNNNGSTQDGEEVLTSETTQNNNDPNAIQQNTIYLDEDTKNNFFNGSMNIKEGNDVAKTYINDLVNNGFDLFGTKGDLTPTDYQFILAHIDPMGKDFSIKKPMNKKELRDARNQFYDTDAGKSMINEMGIDKADKTLNDSPGVYYSVDTEVEPSAAFNKWKSSFDKANTTTKTDTKTVNQGSVESIAQSLEDKPLSKSKLKSNKTNFSQYYVVLTSPKNRSYGTLSPTEELELSEVVLQHLLTEHTLEELKTGETDKAWYSYKDTPSMKYKKMVEVREKALAKLNNK